MKRQLVKYMTEVNKTTVIVVTVNQELESCTIRVFDACALLHYIFTVKIWNDEHISSF